MANQLTYTLWRVRRLWVVSTLVASLGLIPLVWLGFLTSPGAIAAGVVGLGVMMLVFLLIYPTAWMDAIAVPIASALTLCCLPLCAWLVGVAPDHNSGYAAVVLGIALIFFWIFAVLGATVAITALDKFPVGEIMTEANGWFDMPPDEAIRILVLKPETRRPHRQTGSVDADGWFSMRTTYEVPNAETFEMEELEVLIRARELDVPDELDIPEGAQAFVTQEMVDDEGRQTSSVYQQIFAAEAGGTRYRVAEVQNHFTWMSCSGFWLQDFAADHLQAELDLAQGRPTLALCRKPQRTFLTDLARFFDRMEDHPGRG